MWGVRLWMLILVVVVAITINPAGALDRTAASCSQASVQAAIDLALGGTSFSNGDRVVIPAGQCTWTSPVRVSGRNITIAGAGKNATVITVNGVVNAIDLTTTSSRVTGIGFIIGNGSSVIVRAAGQNFRVDNNKFESSFFSNALFSDGMNAGADQPTGVFDHNEHINSRVVVYGAVDSAVWQLPSTVGNPNQTGVTYIEDSTFTANVFANVVDSNGGRYVFRYNSVTNANAEAHSNQLNIRGAKSWEIYNNTFTSNNGFYSPMFIRGGTGVVFNNTITGNYLEGIRLDNVRSFQDLSGPNGRCDGTSAWDGNQTSGHPCRDQIGRGQETAGPFPQAQASEPAYFWNNTFGGNPHSPTVVNCSSANKPNGSCADIVPGRDYFNSSRPAYSPFTYPHPLTGTADSTPPSTPTNLSATPVSSSQINLNWTPSQDNVGVMGYEIYRNSTYIETTELASFSDTALSPSTNYTFAVAAYDAAGNRSALSAPVNAATLPDYPTYPTDVPTASITVPTEGSLLAGDRTVSASVSNSAGVARVQFKLDQNNLGAEDTTPPYAITWNTTTASNGTHTLQAVVRNAMENESTSAPVTVTVDNLAPSAAITHPRSGSIVQRSVRVSATASDNVAVASVQFDLDGVKIGSEDTTSPYSIVWDTTNVSNGSHSLTAVARDTAGNGATSSTTTVIVNNILPTFAFSSADASGQSWTTTAKGDSIRIQHARVQSAGGGGTPSGLAILAYRNGDVLVSEASVPASPPVASGRIYAGLNGSVKTGVAFANPNNRDTVISYYFTDSAGANYRSGHFTLAANRQIAAFLDQEPFAAPAASQGTFTFSSHDPISVVALRGLVNERGEFLMTTLPVSSLNAEFGDALVFPHVASGGGWNTRIVLINPGDVPLRGTIQLLTSAFSYIIPPRGESHFETDSRDASTRTGSARVIPAADHPTPSGVAIFSYANPEGITVSEASVPATPAGLAFRLFVESSGSPGEIGSLRTGLAVSNPSSASVTVRLEVRHLDGSTTGLSAAAEIPARGQRAQFITELFPDLAQEFRGILQLTATAPVILTGLRGRYNERGDFLIATIPPLNETAPQSGEMYFPHIVSGAGYTSRLIIFSGRMQLRNQDGSVETGETLQIDRR